MLKRALLIAAVLLAPAAADQVSGPGRMTLSNESWGSLYYIPAELQDYEYHRNIDTGMRTMQSHLGLVKIHDNEMGAMEITSPLGKVTVEGTSKQAKVNLRGKLYEFRDEGHKFFVITPDDRIEYSFQPNLITASGKKGTTRIMERNGDYKIESPAGVYTYTPTPDGGFIARGVPLLKHPYLYRGALFHESGVGILIDFKKLDPDNPLFQLIDWQPILDFTKGS